MEKKTEETMNFVIEENINIDDLKIGTRIGFFYNSYDNEDFNKNLLKENKFKYLSKTFILKDSEIVDIIIDDIIELDDTSIKKFKVNGNEEFIGINLNEKIQNQLIFLNKNNLN